MMIIIIVVVVDLFFSSLFLFLSCDCPYRSIDRSDRLIPLLLFLLFFFQNLKAHTAWSGIGRIDIHGVMMIRTQKGFQLGPRQLSSKVNAQIGIVVVGSSSIIITTIAVAVYRPERRVVGRRRGSPSSSVVSCEWRWPHPEWQRRRWWWRWRWCGQASHAGNE